MKFIIGTLAHKGSGVNEGVWFLPIYYIDTRNSFGENSWSDIFTSTVNPVNATRFDTYKEAVDWASEFLPDQDHIIFKV